MTARRESGKGRRLRAAQALQARRSACLCARAARRAGPLRFALTSARHVAFTSMLSSRPGTITRPNANGTAR